jgi:hypothetical protein
MPSVSGPAKMIFEAASWRPTVSPSSMVASLVIGPPLKAEVTEAPYLLSSFIKSLSKAISPTLSWIYSILGELLAFRKISSLWSIFNPSEIQARSSSIILAI